MIPFILFIYQLFHALLLKYKVKKEMSLRKLKHSTCHMLARPPTLSQCHLICMGSHTSDIVINSVFRRNPFVDIRATGLWKSPIPITLAVDFYKSLDYHPSHNVTKPTQLPECLMDELFITQKVLHSVTGFTFTLLSLCIMLLNVISAKLLPVLSILSSTFCKYKECYITMQCIQVAFSV